MRRSLKNSFSMTAFGFIVHAQRLAAPPRQTKNMAVKASHGFNAALTMSITTPRMVFKDPETGMGIKKTMAPNKDGKTNFII